MSDQDSTDDDANPTTMPDLLQDSLETDKLGGQILSWVVRNPKTGDPVVDSKGFVKRHQSIPLIQGLVSSGYQIDRYSVQRGPI